VALAHLNLLPLFKDKEELVLAKYAASVLSSAFGGTYGMVLSLCDHSG
jgi:hypothetical protein